MTCLGAFDKKKLKIYEPSCKKLQMNIYYKHSLLCTTVISFTRY